MMTHLSSSPMNLCWLHRTKHFLKDHKKNLDTVSVLFKIKMIQKDGSSAEIQFSEESYLLS